MAWLWTFCLALSFFPRPALAKDVSFPQNTLRIGGQTLTVEVATTEEQHQRGLMFRKSLPESTGMLFVFDRDQVLHFWMKNTFIDLDIGYFTGTKILVDVQTMKAAGSVMEQRPPTYSSKEPAKYALEVPAGWFVRNGIKKGAVFSLGRVLDDGPAKVKSSSKSGSKTGR